MAVQINKGREHHDVYQCSLCGKFADYPLICVSTEHHGEKVDAELVGHADFYLDAKNILRIDLSTFQPARG